MRANTNRPRCSIRSPGCSSLAAVRPHARLLWSLGWLAAGCASQGPQPAPAWIQTPPPHTGRALVFVGQAQGRDGATARELAVGRALTELSKYCGAEVSSNFELVDAEIDGRSVQRVKETVTVSGETLALEQVTVEETLIQPRPGGGYDGYARIRWPRSQYARLQAKRRAQAMSALEPFFAAEAALKARRPAEARRQLGEAAERLGDSKAEVPLEHERFAHSGMLHAAIAAAGRAVDELEAERARSLAVGVDCRRSAEPAPCPADRVGRVRERVTAVGLSVASRAVPSGLVRAIASAAAPTLGPEDRTTAFLLAVTYDTESLGEQDGFVFARCGARAVVFDTDAGRIVDMTEVQPKKGGHVHLEGAMARGCREAESELSRWLDTTLPRLVSAP